MENSFRPDSTLEVATIKLLILGDVSVGKTSLLLRYSNNEYIGSYFSTIGINFKSKMINFEGNYYQIQLWDTAGQEKYKTIVRTYYKKASGIILAYDSTDINSLTNIKTWINIIYNEIDPSVPLVLAATKCDLKDSAELELQSKTISEETKLKIFETSSKSGDNVEKLFHHVIKRTIDEFKMSRSLKSSILQHCSKTKYSKKTCC